jgi:hypothetical protein
MRNLRSSRLTLMVLAAAVVILVAGGIAIASNMGFKLNKPIVFAGVLQKGNNWTSIPFKNPYSTVGGFCLQTGLTTGSIKATVVTLDENTGSFSPAISCGTATANSTLLIPGKGLQVRQPNVTGAPTSIIIVGSHDASLSLTVPKAGTGQKGNFWFSVPYHTTAATANDLCLSIGLSTGTIKASVTRLDASLGTFTNVFCGTATAAATPLVLGESVQLRDPVQARTFNPAHF